jgi:hypothetical protein
MEEANTPAPVTPEPTKSVTLSDLTEQNWLFIKAYLNTGNVRKSYKLAGYTGKSESAAYVLFNSLKSRIEEIGSVDTLGRTRLMAEVNKLLDLPLDNNKNNVSLTEKLRVIKLAAALTPEVQAAKPNLSVFVINRYGPGAGKPGETITPRADIAAKDVIDVDAIPEK